MRLMMLVLLLASVNAAGAAGKTTVRAACEFNYPVFVQLDTPDGSTDLNRHDFWELTGQEVARVRGQHAGTIILLDVDNRALAIEVYRQGRRWTLLCDNGVVVRVKDGVV